MSEMITRADYKAKYPNVTQCPECHDPEDPTDECMIDGVCYYCICGCDWCEAGRPKQFEIDQGPIRLHQPKHTDHVHVALNLGDLADVNLSEKPSPKPTDPIIMKDVEGWLKGLYG